MSEMLRKARKKYICDNCDAEIKKGDLYYYTSTRQPAYSEDGMGNDVQTGIFYDKARLCYDTISCFHVVAEIEKYN